MAPLPTGTVTFLFTDIEGSTKLLQRLADNYARALGEHQALLRAAWTAHGGVEVDTAGDGFFVTFPSAPQAVAAAAEATRALAAHPWPEDTAFRVRIGLHTGTPHLVGDHYIGLDVHHAARIMAAGHGGQILLSQTTRDLAATTLPAGVTLRELGAHRLKDLREPEPLYQLILPGLPADFPALKTLDSRPHNLPVQPTPLLGREEHLATVRELLCRDNVRLVTLTGPGGIGKTRLSVQVAAELVEDFPDGVWSVRLSRLTDPGLVIPTIAQTLGLREQGSQSIAETLYAYLASKRLLLLLDNFEQVVGAATEIAGVLESSPGVKVLVTSRLPLHLRGERVYPVPPLPLASADHLPPLEQLTEYAAVALFIQRAEEAKPDFVVTAANAPAIAEICVRLDGLPLAIELATARVRVLPPEALLARLSAQLKLLTGGARDAEARQQTMRATITWSEALLTPAEQVLFRRLAVFAGGCTLEAAEAVCLAPEAEVPLAVDLLDGLSTLVDHSLIQQREEGGEPRFGMLHVIREYAHERLEASGEAEALRRSHAGYFLALAEQAEPQLLGPHQRDWFDRLEREHDNLRAVLAWARERGETGFGLRLANAIVEMWWVGGHAHEGRGWLEVMLAAPAQGDAPGDVSVRVRARALANIGRFAFWQGDYAPAAALLEHSAELARALGDLHTLALALNTLGNVASLRRETDRAIELYTESMEVARQAGDRLRVGNAQGNLGVTARYRGDLETATVNLEAALTIMREAGDGEAIATFLDELGRVDRKAGRLDQSRMRQREALRFYRAAGTRWGLADALTAMAATAGAAGQGVQAARLLGAVSPIFEASGLLQPWIDREDAEQAVAEARAALGEEAWQAAYEAGRALSLDEAIAEALGDADVAPL